MGCHQSKERINACSVFEYLKKFVIDLESWEKAHLAMGTLALISSAATNLTYPRLVGAIIDSTTSNLSNVESSDSTPFYDLFGISKYFGANDSCFKKLLFTAIPLYMIGSLSSYLRVYNFQKAKYLIEKRYRMEVYRTIMLQGLPFFHFQNSGSLVNNLVKDCEDGPRTLIDCFAQFLRASNSLFGGSFNLIIISPKLAGISLLMIPIFAFTAMGYSRLLNRLKGAEKELQNGVFSYVSEAISGIETVKYFGMEEFEINKFFILLQSIDNAAEMVASANGGFMATILAGTNVCMLVIMYLGSQQMNEGFLTVGNLASFAIYGGMFGLGASSMSKVVAEVTRASVALKSIYDALQLPIQRHDGLILHEVRGKIEFRSVHFSYPGRHEVEIFKGLNLTILPGDTVAIVGTSGAGKSTIFLLFSTLFKPTSGKVLLDDVDIETLDFNWYRQSVFGIVSQEPVLFSGTIFDNICYGCQYVTAEQVYEAAMKSNIHDFIESLPNKYATLVGQNGVMLSMGQKQRIAIARAIIRDPPILLLDEATSALDACSESIVQAALERAMDGRTVLMVTHKESSLKRASKVVVLDKGEIVASGKPTQVAQNDVYKRIFNVKSQ